MSLVADVLTSIKQRSGAECSSLVGDGVCVEVADLAKRATEAKVAVIQALDEQYTQLSSALQDTTALQTRVEHNLQGLERLQSSLDGEVQAAVTLSVNAVTGVAGRWQRAVEELKVAQQLLVVHEALKKAEEDYEGGDYRAAAQGLSEVEELVCEVPCEVEVLPSVLEEVHVQRSRLAYELLQLWDQMFKWEEEGDRQTNTITLRVRSVVSGDTADLVSGDGVAVQPAAADTGTLLAALHWLGELDNKMHTLAKDVLNNLLRVAVSREVLVSSQCQPQCSSLSITFTLPPERGSASVVSKPSHHTVFSNIKQLLTSLNEFCFGVEFEIGDDRVANTTTATNTATTTTTTLMRLLGEKIGSSFTEFLISDCLAAAVPYTRKNLGEFDMVKADTNVLHQDLVNIGFYSPSEVSILDYAANVDTVFSDKACGHLLSTARDLITQPLHDTVTVAPQEGYPPLAIQDESGTRLEKSTLRLEKLLAAKTFHMPHCQISKSACSLVDLLYETLEEACGSSPAFAGRLVCTVRNVLELYNHVLPVAHAATLSSIPQHAALVHNNCMFITNHCFLLGHQFKTRLPTGLSESGSCVTSYTDIAHQIRCTGTDIFCAAMQRHKKALLDTIGQAQGFGEVPSDIGVRQVLHQLQQLRNVWHPVLPTMVYNKAMGTLVNSVVKELIDRVLSLEDISEDSAAALTNSLTIIKAHGPSLFPDVAGVDRVSVGGAAHKEGVCGVRQWGRYQELLVVLAASLRELQDRWADGKGPLAAYFTADQAKSLVRALFQNTDRRAQLLSRIKVQ